MAQKPTHVGARCARDGSDKAAHRDHDRLRAARAAARSSIPIDPEADLREPEHVAAGMNALLQSTMFTFRQMGPMRGLKTWLKVNKRTASIVRAARGRAPINTGTSLSFARME